MGLLARIFGRTPATEQRDMSWSMGVAYGYSLSRGASAVPVAEAENLAAVLGCVELICGAVASLPASLVIDTADGQQPAPPTAPAWRLLDRPNEQQSWPAFASWIAAQYLLQGNGVAALQFDGRGAVSGLLPAPWPWLQPMIIDSASGTRLVFDVLRGLPEARLIGLPDRLLDSDVMHVRNRSDTGLIGRSVLSRAPGPVREGITTSTMAQKNWENGARPSMVFEIEKFLPEAQRKRFDEETKEKLVGAINSGGWALLEGGMKAKGVSLSSVDAEFLSTRNYSIGEIARIFKVPEPLVLQGPRAIADLSPYTTAFYQQAVVPVIAAIESEFSYRVLPPGMRLVIDADGAMRGSFATAVAGLTALKQSAIITANDAREAMDWPPVEGGDVLSVGPAPSYPPDASGLPAMHPSPGPADDQPQLPSHGNSGRKPNGSAVMQ
jgi:HK97 family phage portal protein